MRMLSRTIFLTYGRVTLMNIQLRKFDMSQIKDDKVVVMVGKRDTGKFFV